MGRRWVLSAIAVGAVAGLVFAIFPQWDLAIPGWFFDPVRGDFPLAIRWFPNLIRSIGHWTTLLIVLAAGGSLLAKILFPRTKALLSPRIALFLVCSFAIGPVLIVNGILKPTWARPRPVFVQEFGKQQTFEPWWKSGGECRSNCSFVSGDAAAAFCLLSRESVRSFWASRACKSPPAEHQARGRGCRTRLCRHDQQLARRFWPLLPNRRDLCRRHLGDRDRRLPERLSEDGRQQDRATPRAYRRISP